MSTQNSEQSVLIIGGSGFIGQNTIAYLAARGYQIAATHSPHREAPRISGVEWFPIDLADPAVDFDALPRYNTVIFLAQSRKWRDFPNAAADVFNVNIGSTFRAVDYARKTAAKRFIYASSGSVYTQTDHVSSEVESFDAQATRGFYPASKLIGELLLNTYRNFLPIISLRLFVPYGTAQNPDMLIPQLIRRVQTGQAITLQGQDGMRINPTAAIDVAETIHRCLGLDTSECLNVAGPDLLTLRQIGEHIGKALSLPVKFELQADRIPATIAGDTSALQKRLGWAPKIDFQTGLKAAI